MDSDYQKKGADFRQVTEAGACPRENSRSLLMTKGSRSFRPGCSDTLKVFKLELRRRYDTSYRQTAVTLISYSPLWPARALAYSRRCPINHTSRSAACFI